MFCDGTLEANISKTGSTIADAKTPTSPQLAQEIHPGSSTMFTILSQRNKKCN
jgi:hypothetical protein